MSGEEFDNRAIVRNYKGVRVKSVPTVERKGLATVTSLFLQL